eukprot:Skav204802  [mRNA]  locus=scaffold763:574295:577546:+ [translate_table: standard]
MGVETQLLAGDVQWREEEAARLLSRSALEALSQWFQPAGRRLCVETSDNVDEALDALLEDEKAHVVDFLSDREVAGEAPVEEFQQTAKVVEQEVAPQGSQAEARAVKAALGVLLARQQFVAACRFGYFLRRCQQRLRLERARATDLFGTLSELLRERGELELTAEGRVRLSVEAVVFGAALFDAEVGERN